MSDTPTITPPAQPPAAAPAPPAAASPAPATADAPKAETPPADASAAMRTALLRAQVAQVLGPVQAPWVLDAAIAAAKPDLLADFTGLTGPSRERVAQWKAENAFAFQAAQAAAAQPTPTAQEVTTVMQPTQAKTEPLPATPGSNVGVSGGLSTDEMRRLSQIHVDPRSITTHPDFQRTRAFWAVQ